MTRTHSHGRAASTSSDSTAGYSDSHAISISNTVHDSASFFDIYTPAPQHASFPLHHSNQNMAPQTPSPSHSYISFASPPPNVPSFDKPPLPTAPKPVFSGLALKSK